MLLAFARRILLFLAVLLGISFGLIFLHSVQEAGTFSRAWAALGALLALANIALLWVTLTRADDFLIPPHAKAFFIASASIAMLLAAGLFSFFFFQEEYSRAYLRSFGAAPLALAAGYIIVAIIRTRESFALPPDYREQDRQGRLREWLPLLLSLPLLIAAAAVLALTLGQVSLGPDAGAAEQAEETPQGPADVQSDSRPQVGELLEAARFAQDQNRYRRAYELFRQAAELGSAEADFELALIYSGDGFLHNMNRARTRLERAAASGHSEALFRMGTAYRHGEFEVEQDFEKALVLLSQAAEKGHAPAQMELGQMHTRGQGVKADPEEAFRWFMRAAQQGYAPAQNNIGIFYLSGAGVEASVAEGLKWLELAAGNGIEVAQYNLGAGYYEGEWGEKDYARAFQYFDQLGRKGKPVGLRMVGLQYLQGQGVEQDEAAAFDAFARGASGGDLFSQYYLGYCYLNGIGTEKDTAAGIAQLGSAARRGQTDAQLLLANIHLEGSLLVQDKVEAAKWLTLAASAGSKNALERLEALRAELSEREAAAVDDLVTAFRRNNTP